MNMRHQGLAKRRRRRNQGLLLIESLLGSVMLMLATVTILALLPEV